MIDPMMNVPENELFSAYVDGELTAAEQADVERLLAASPAARQLVEDLRALSSTLQSLPARKLDEDLSQQVLRLAEHRVLSGQTHSDPLPREPVAAPSRWQAIARRLSRPRIWVWPGVAVAVSLLLMVLNPEPAQRFAGRPAEEHVAFGPPAPARTVSESSSIGAAAGADRAGRDEESRLLLSADGKRGESVERLASASASAPVETKKAAPVGHVTNVPVPLAEPAPAEAKKDAAKVALRPAAMPAAPSAPAASPPTPPTRPMKTAVADLPADVRPAKEGLGGRADKATEELTVVLCDVTPKAMELQFVEQTLAKRQVVLLARPANIGDDRGRAFGGGFALAEMEKKPEVARREADSAAAGDKLAPQSGMGADSGKIVFLRAEATPEQLEAVLVDLRSKPEMVRSLARESGVAGPVADGTEQWFFFGRAASVMKQKGDSAPGKSLAAQSAPRDAARGFQTAEPMERWDVNVQDRPAEARSAGGARGAAQMQGAQDPSATANMVQSESVTNRLQNMEMQRRAVEKRGQEGQEMYGATRQKAIDATQALGVRAAGPSVKKAERKAQQGEQQADESESHPPAGAAAAPAQQAMPGGQAGAVAGYRSPSPATAKAKSLADASFDAKAQREVKRPVVFVVRAVGPDPIAAEKAGKPAAAAPK